MIDWWKKKKLRTCPASLKFYSTCFKVKRIINSFCVAEEMDYSCAWTGALAALAESRWSDSLCSQVSKKSDFFPVLSLYVWSFFINSHVSHIMCLSQRALHLRLGFISQMMIMHILCLTLYFVTEQLFWLVWNNTFPPGTKTTVPQTPWNDLMIRIWSFWKFCKNLLAFASSV